MMFKLILKPQHILIALGVIILAMGCYVGWQAYPGQPLAGQDGTNPQKSAQTPDLEKTTFSATPAASSGSSGSSSAPAPLPGTPSAEDYKQLMAQTYQQTLRTMQDVKEKTLALQDRKLSLTAYRSSILQAQAAFSRAEQFVRANPPAKEKLNPSYQEFLAGINLANQAMDVLLQGISSFSPSKLYDARDMGKQAQQQVIDGYSHF